MESKQQKRKLQDTMESFSESKKPHNEEDITFSDIGADSTHLDEESESELVNTIVENQTKDDNRHNSDEDLSIADAIASVYKKKF